MGNNVWYGRKVMTEREYIEERKMETYSAQLARLEEEGEMTQDEAADWLNYTAVDERLVTEKIRELAKARVLRRRKARNDARKASENLLKWLED